LKLLADENIPWPLVKVLWEAGLEVEWVPETSYRGISDKELLDKANDLGFILLTRDSDFLHGSLRRRVRHGIIYVGEPVRKDNVVQIARNILTAMDALRRQRRLAIVTSATIEFYPLG